MIIGIDFCILLKKLKFSDQNIFSTKFLINNSCPYCFFLHLFNERSIAAKKGCFYRKVRSFLSAHRIGKHIWRKKSALINV